MEQDAIEGKQSKQRNYGGELETMSMSTNGCSTTSRVFAKLPVVIISACSLAWISAAATAQPSSLEIPINKSQLISVERAVSRVSVGEPGIADILITSPKQVYVLGKSLGTTNVVLWDERDRSFATFDVSVTHDLSTLKAQLYELFPEERPEIYSSQQHLVVGGQISSVIKMDAIARVASTYAQVDKKEKQTKIINLMQVGGVQQVMLEVKVAELARNVLKRLGVNLASLRPGSQQTRIGLINGGATFPDLLLPPDDLRVPIFGPLDGSVNPIGPVVDEFAPVEPAVSGPGLFLSFLDPRFFLQAVIDAAKENGLAKIMAEPTLVSLTGQEAQFLSGGEFPIPVADDDGISVEFKEFGIGLKFLPVVLDSGRISLKVNVVVSELTSANSVIVGVPTTNTSFAVPALTKRSAQSTVELNDGESLSIAGLISDSMRDAVTKFPGLGDVPVFGQLFRSQEFQQDKTELVIFVTARLAQPTSPDQIRLPTDGLVMPSDLEYYLLGKTPGKHIPKAGNLAVSQRMNGTGTEFGHDLKGLGR